MKNRITHFEIHVSDPKRAMEFYTTVFGWRFEQWGTEQYWMAMTAEKDDKDLGINGGLMLRKGEPPIEGAAVNAYVCTVQVDNIDDIIAKVTAAGGVMAVPKFAFPGMAWQAYYKDTEGNIFGIHQTDTNAK